MERSDRVILIEADHQELLGRSIAHREDPDRFDKLEFGEERCRVYGTAGRVVSFRDVDKDQAARRLEQVIRDFREDSS
ncbi:MAG: hypothetical protein ACYDEY_14695 [Acidimicrobiales bacterium]